MSEVNAREFELRFKGLHRQPDVVARTVGKLNHPNEVIHVIEHSAYEQAQEKIKTLEARVEKLRWALKKIESLSMSMFFKKDDLLLSQKEYASIALKEDEEC